MREFYTTLLPACQAENYRRFTGNNFSLYRKNEYHVKEKNRYPLQKLWQHTFSGRNVKRSVTEVEVDVTLHPLVFYDSSSFLLAEGSLPPVGELT
jgi:hypothetical protein